MSNKFQTKEFKDLKDKWYKKLEKSGFVDLEQNEDQLKQWEAGAFGNRYSVETFSSNQKYFELAGQFFFDNKFVSKLEKKVWELHSKGITLYAIADKVKVIKKSKVHMIIQKLSKEMLTKYGSNDEQN